jgi:hypothetical protein
MNQKKKTETTYYLSDGSSIYYGILSMHKPLYIDLRIIKFKNSSLLRRTQRVRVTKLNNFTVTVETFIK